MADVLRALGEHSAPCVPFMVAYDQVVGFAHLNIGIMYVPGRDMVKCNFGFKASLKYLNISGGASNYDKEMTYILDC